METHNMAVVDGKIGLVVGGDELDEDYNRCILPPNNDRHPSKPLSKRGESQTQDKKAQRCFKWREVGHIRRTCHNLRADFNASYEGEVVNVEDLFDGSYTARGVRLEGMIHCM